MIELKKLLYALCAFEVNGNVKWEAVRLHPRELPGWNRKLAPVPRGQGEAEERGRPLEIGRWQFYIWGLGGQQDKNITAPTCQNLKSLYRGLNGVQSGIQSRWSQYHITLSRVILEMVPATGTVGRVYIPRTGERVRSLWLPKSSSWVNWQPRPLDDLPPKQQSPREKATIAVLAHPSFTEM